MKLYNGDRVCFRNRLTHKYDFGRIVEYVDEEPTFPVESGGSTTTTPAKKKDEFTQTSLSVCESSGGPGFSSPMLTKSRSQPDLTKDGERKKTKVKRLVVWENNDYETEVKWKDEHLFKVVDRKFSVGQRVFRNGVRGKVIEIVPEATVEVIDSSQQSVKKPTVIPNLRIDDLRPLHSIFSGVNVEFQGWIGQVSDVQRRVVYRMEDSTDSTFLSSTFVDSQFSRRKTNKATTSKSQSRQSRTPTHGFGYPFMPESDMPYEGKVEKLVRSFVKQLRNDEENDKENNETLCSAVSSSNSASTSANSCDEKAKSEKADDYIIASVESVSIVGITVRWTGRLPAYLIKGATEKEKASRNTSNSTKIPPSILRGDDVNFIRPLYIHPAIYFEKRGLCLTSIPAGESCGAESSHQYYRVPISEKKWTHNLYKSLGKEESGRGGNDDSHGGSFNLSAFSFFSPAKEEDSSGENPATSIHAKRKRCHDDEAHPAAKRADKDVIVCKHFVRHMYQVIWDCETNCSAAAASSSLEGEKPAELHYGFQLEPDLMQEHKLCLGFAHSHLYVVPRKGSWMEGKWDYGVVIEKPSDSSVIVEWMNVCGDGSMATDRALKCQLLEIDNHPLYNELHEGRTVVRAKDANRFKMCEEFSFGTIVSVQRFALGQISVYCPIQKKVLELWPHMLEVFVGMSMQELISHKVVGLRKSNLCVEEHNLR